MYVFVCVCVCCKNILFVQCLSKQLFKDENLMTLSIVSFISHIVSDISHHNVCMNGHNVYHSLWVQSVVFST